jgi:hypothetical protein
VGFGDTLFADTHIWNIYIPNGVKGSMWVTKSLPTGIHISAVQNFRNNCGATHSNGDMGIGQNL